MPIDPPPSPAPTGLRPDEVAFIGDALAAFFVVLMVILVVALLLAFTAIVVRATRD